MGFWIMRRQSDIMWEAKFLDTSTEYLGKGSKCGGQLDNLHRQNLMSSYAGSMIKYHRNLTSRGYRALIFNGDHDMCVPYTGSEAWTRSLGYKIIDEWRPWFVNGQIAGYIQG